MPVRTIILLSAFFTAISCGLISAQETPGLQPANNPGAAPKITFTFNWTSANPQFFKLEVDSTGRAAYSSQGSKANSEPYSEKFTMGAADRQRIFDLARQAGYFNGNFDYTKTRVANMGAKTANYADSARHFTTTYNWSQNQLMDEFTRIMANISATTPDAASRPGTEPPARQIACKRSRRRRTGRYHLRPGPAGAIHAGRMQHAAGGSGAALELPARKSRAPGRCRRNCGRPSNWCEAGMRRGGMQAAARC